MTVLEDGSRDGHDAARLTASGEALTAENAHLRAALLASENRAPEVATAGAEFSPSLAPPAALPPALPASPC